MFIGPFIIPIKETEEKREERKQKLFKAMADEAVRTPTTTSNNRNTLKHSIYFQKKMNHHKHIQYHIFLGTALCVF